VAELAAASSSSTATVVRLARALGFPGFPALQARLRDELSVRRSGPVERFQLSASLIAGNGLLADMAGVLAELARSVAATVPAAEFAEAVALLGDTARHVYLMGGRVTHVLAEYLESHLSRLRGDVTLLPQQSGRRAAALLDAAGGDVLVAFDVRRYERETVESTRLAQQRGAKVILVTDVLMSPSAAHAAIVLPVRVETPSPFDSAVAGIVVVEALALGTLTTLGDGALQRMRAWDGLAERELVAD
jgi:DNA-binding MurR/RpiR family transcriptional regulator